MFLHHVAYHISRPIKRDDRIHIDYVPTQVVTEFVRSVLTYAGEPVEGIKYSSTRHSGGTSVVLFADQNNVVLPPELHEQYYGLHTDRFLALVGREERQVTEENLKLWADEAPRRSPFFIRRPPRDEDE